MKNFKRWIPFLISLIVIYSLAYFHEYDFGFDEKVNNSIVKSIHLLIFGIFGFLTCYGICSNGDRKLRSPHATYAFGIIFFVAIIGVFNEVRIHPHEGNVRDILLHINGGVLGMVIWRLTKFNSEI